MRKWFLISVLFFCAAAAHAQIVLVASCAAVATSCVPSVVGGHTLAAGQFEYTFAYKSSTSAPPKPSSYTQIATALASSSSMRSGCAVLTSSTPDSDAWTSATLVISLVYSGTGATSTANCVTSGIGFKTTGGTSGTTSAITFTGGSLTNGNGSSWIVAAVGSSAAVCTPSTVLHSEITTTDGNGLDTNGVVTSYSSKTCTGSTGNWRSDTFELLAAANTNPTYSPTSGTGQNNTMSLNITTSTGATCCYNTCSTSACTPSPAPASTTSGTCSSGTTLASSGGVCTITGITGPYYGITTLATQAALANSAAETANFTFTAATPAITLAPGTYTTSLPKTTTVTEAGGAPTVCCSFTTTPATNGTTGCTTGTLYSGALTIPTGTHTLTCIAGGTHYLDGSTITAAYTITPTWAGWNGVTP